MDFMAEVGAPLDPWQALLVHDTFGVRPDGYWAAFEVAALVPRQNGKGRYTEAVELAGLVLFGDRLIMHSAHLFKTSKQSFQRLVEVIDNSDWLRRRVKKVIRARGDEEIELLSRFGGGRLLYFSRSGGSGRGFTGDKTVFDEAQYLTIEQYQAATPTLATVPNPQIIYTGTPPDEDVGPMPEDAMMPSVRRRGHEGGDRIALSEWGPPEAFDRRDPRLWAACNPAMGIRISEWFLAKQLENFTAAGKPEKFDTEHLGVWPPDSATAWAVVSEATWNRALDPQSQIVDPVVFALDVRPERTHSAVAVVGSRPDRQIHGEIVAHAAGTDWVIPRVVELADRWRPTLVVVDPAGAAGSLVADLVKALAAKIYGFEPTLLNARDVAQGYGMFHDCLASRAPRRLRVRDTAPSLTAAVAGAATRRIGDGTTWDRKSTSVDISPLVALTNALHGFMSLPPPLPPPSAPTRVATTDLKAVFRPSQRLKL